KIVGQILLPHSKVIEPDGLIPARKREIDPRWHRRQCQLGKGQTKIGDLLSRQWKEPQLANRFEIEEGRERNTCRNHKGVERSRANLLSEIGPVTIAQG